MRHITIDETEDCITHKDAVKVRAELKYISVNRHLLRTPRHQLNRRAFCSPLLVRPPGTATGITSATELTEADLRRLLKEFLFSGSSNSKTTPYERQGRGSLKEHSQSPDLPSVTLYPRTCPFWYHKTLF